MFDIGWSELLLIGIVALIVVGPRDLPALFRALGRMTAKARGMAREFSNAMEDAARDSGLDEASKSLRDVKGLTSKKGLGIDRLERAVDKFEKWDPKIPSARDGLKKDPAQAAPDQPATGSPAPVKVSPVKVSPAKASPAQGTSAESVAAPPPAAPPREAGPDDHGPVPGQRRLHAVRRRDSKDS